MHNDNVQHVTFKYTQKIHTAIARTARTPKEDVRISTAGDRCIFAKSRTSKATSVIATGKTREDK